MRGRSYAVVTSFFQRVSIQPTRYLASKRTMVKLTEEQRKEVLNPLLTEGWKMVDGRDAMQKSFQFKDFNEVHICFQFRV
ncbi:4a-hydroxytetrahydrobiopterin dehydratase domain protein [Cooperia oncophora]